MNITTIYKKLSVSLASILATGILMSGGVAHAIPYTGTSTNASPVPAFNVFTGNNLPAPAPSDGEQDFFQARVPSGGNLDDATTPYSDPVSTSCTNGEVIQLHIYVHNGANADANDNGTGPSVAHGVQVKVALPTGQATDFDPTATISANNAATVSDGVDINCNGQSAQLQYIDGSASQFSNGAGELPLSDAIISSGVPIQSEQTPGDVWGCWNERVYIVLAVKVVVTPPTPMVTATCNLLKVEANADRVVTVSQFNYTATNAAFKSLVINWGDNSANTTVTDSSQVVGTTHQYANDGSYNVSGTVNFTASGQSVPSSGGIDCEQVVTFSSTTPPTVTPPTQPAPTSLVNTGPGSIAGIFAGATAIGTLGYRWILSRRLSRQ